MEERGLPGPTRLLAGETSARGFPPGERGHPGWLRERQGPPATRGSCSVPAGSPALTAWVPPGAGKVRWRTTLPSFPGIGQAAPAAVPAGGLLTPPARQSSAGGHAGSVRRRGRGRAGPRRTLRTAESWGADTCPRCPASPARQSPHRPPPLPAPPPARAGPAQAAAGARSRFTYRRERRGLFCSAAAPRGRLPSRLRPSRPRPRRQPLGPADGCSGRPAAPPSRRSPGRADPRGLPPAPEPALPAGRPSRRQAHRLAAAPRLSPFI